MEPWLATGSRERDWLSNRLVPAHLKRGEDRRLRIPDGLLGPLGAISAAAASLLRASCPSHLLAISGRAGVGTGRKRLPSSIRRAWNHAPIQGERCDAPLYNLLFGLGTYMASRRLRGKTILSLITGTLEPNSFQRNPYLPSLLNQPDLLVIPAPGRLVALYVYDFSERVTWRLVLGAIEDLFELKTTVGPDVRAVAIVVTEAGEASPQTPRSVRSDMLRLVSNSFDFSERLTGDGLNSASHLVEQLVTVQPRAGLADLWRAEAEYQATALRRHYHEPELESLIDTNIKPSRRPKRHTAEEVIDAIQTLNPGPIEQAFLVRNAKGGLGGLGRDYSFEFDLRVGTHPPTLVDFFQSDRYGMREKLRYMLAKARLIRYWISDGRVQHRAPDFRPLLIVDGNIAGPDHDPYRYVRLLVSVGWRIARHNERERISWLIENADI